MGMMRTIPAGIGLLIVVLLIILSVVIDGYLAQQCMETAKHPIMECLG